MPCPKCKSSENLHIEDIRSRDEHLQITSVCKRMSKKGKICGGMQVIRYRQQDMMRKKQRRRFTPRKPRK